MYQMFHEGEKMNSVKDEDTLRKAIKNFVYDGSPQNLKDALKILHKDASVNKPQSRDKNAVKD